MIFFLLTFYYIMINKYVCNLGKSYAYVYREVCGARLLENDTPTLKRQRGNVGSSRNFSFTILTNGLSLVLFPTISFALCSTEEVTSECKRQKGIGIGSADGPVSLDDVRSLQRSNSVSFCLH